MSKSSKDLPADLQEWAELLARHHRSLRRPLATGRPVGEAGEPTSEDRRDGEQQQPKPAR